MIKIKIIKSMATRRIKSRMYEGQRLSERLTHDNLSQLKGQHIEWSQNVVSALGGMFSDKTLANEFQAVGLISFDENDSHFEEKNRLLDTIKQQLKWLASLAERIDEFPQAHNTPVASHGRSS